MHDHIFSETEPSVRSEVLGLFDTVIDKFEGVGPDAEWVVDNAKSILSSVEDIINDVSGQIDPEVNEIYAVLKEIQEDYSNFSVTTTVTTPFAPITTPITIERANETITLPCDYCQSIGAQISDINNTFTQAVDVVKV